MHNTMTDVRTRLESQHEHIRSLLEAVASAAREGDDLARENAFDRLQTYLAVHEAAEEEGLHALGHRAVGADAAVDARVEEETAAERAMGRLEGLEAGSAEWGKEFEEFRLRLLAHAEAEVREELPRLEQALTDEQVDELLVSLRRVDAIAEIAEWTGPFSDRLRAAREDFAVPHERDVVSSVVPDEL